MKRKDPATRSGRNAPTEREARLVETFDRVRAILNEYGIPLEEVADGVNTIITDASTGKVTVADLSHLRTNLTEFSYSTRQKADALCCRFLAWARRKLEAYERADIKPNCVGAPTLGKHLRRELQVMRQLRQAP